MLGRLKSYKPYYLSTFLLAGPVVVSQLGHTLVQTADTVIVGHLQAKYRWQLFPLYTAYLWLYWSSVWE